MGPVNSARPQAEASELGATVEKSIYIYRSKYIYIKLSTVALKIPSCPGEARGAGIGTVSSLERA